MNGANRRRYNEAWSAVSNRRLSTAGSQVNGLALWRLRLVSACAQPTTPAAVPVPVPMTAPMPKPPQARPERLSAQAQAGGPPGPPVDAACRMVSQVFPGPEKSLLPFRFILCHSIIHLRPEVAFALLC